MKSERARTSMFRRLLRGSGKALFVALVLAGGWLMRGACAPVGDGTVDDASVADPHAGHGGAPMEGLEAPPAAAEDEVVWSCSMDPQVQQPGPGLCPICGMDLIPVTLATGVGLRQLALTHEAVALAGLQTTPVERRFPVAEIRMVGLLGHDETRRRHVTTRIPGWIERLFVDYVGVSVQAGDHLVEIYSPELLAAQEELLESQRTLEELERMGTTTLLESTRLSVEEGRKRLMRWDMTAAQIDDLLASGSTSDHTTIYAQRAGVVVEKLVEEGTRVGEGTRLYSLDDLRYLWLSLDAYESDLSWIHYGQKVEFEAEAYPGERFQGTIAFIARELDPRTRTIKVRVNVPNPDERLKPGMFVRAVVRSRLAGNGELMDPELAGKWICPMHPEVVKVAFGTCDLCGMDLVTTESLGWLPASQLDVEPPLVVPASAVLATGKRAVVYVQVRDQKNPTFEGREILLGPRAGDVYIVRNGLEDGELVVTRGNFKLDSALQIQAKPSMMSPEGGGGAGVHDHGGPTPDRADDEAAVPAGPELAGGLRYRLERLAGRAGELSSALAEDDLAAARGVMAAVASDLAAIEVVEIPEPLRPTWGELAMRLSNDAVEGGDAASLEDARALAPELERRLMHLAGAFGLVVPGPSGPAEELPVALIDRLETLWAGYAPLARALAEDELEGARAALATLAETLAESEAVPLGGEFGEAWATHREALEGALAALDFAEDMKSLRAAFAPLNVATEAALVRFGAPGGAPVYRVRCPMAFEGEGGDWLSADEEVRNPYYGSMMYACGSVVGAIQPGGGAR